jgi:hypothetical protein
LTATPARDQGQRTGRTLKTLAAAGVLAAALIAALVNILVARFYKRWDWTSQGLYTLSAATRETLAGLREPIDVVVFLSASDPLNVSVRHMLSSYGSETTRLRPRFVDPDRNPAEFLALQQKYGIVSGKTEDGRLVTDASLVIVRGERHWFVTTEDMVQYDENDGRARPKLEQALTEGIRNVLEKERAKICSSTGHQEMSIDDGGPNGPAELRYRLEKNNYEVEAIDLAAPGGTPPLVPCRVLMIAGPEVAFDGTASERIASYLKAGGNALILANPLLDEDNRMRPNGLAPVIRLFGIEFNDDFVIEKDPELRHPSGIGETFFVTPKEHDITKGLLRGEKVAFRVLVSAAQSLRATPGGTPATLLTTSAASFSVRDIRPFVDSGSPVEKAPGDPAGPFAIAMAGELPKLANAPQGHGPRLVVVGSANVVWSRNWREPTLLGSRLFIESALSWLSARPVIVSVPEKASHDVGLSLTEESLGEVQRYVLMYMPGAAALLGILIMYRRRSAERKSRRDGPGARKPKPEAPPESQKRGEQEESAKDRERDAKGDRDADKKTQDEAG